MVNQKYYNFTAQPMFNRDTIAGIDVDVLTAYFVDPKTICQAGRNAQTLKTVGTGNGLWLQNGTDPIRDSFVASLAESDVSSTKWVKGACFPTMGKTSSIVKDTSDQLIAPRCSLLVRQSSRHEL
jgi:hypothetical protein